MVAVRALQKCFIDNRLREVGAEFEYTGEIHSDVLMSLEEDKPVDIPKKPRKKPKPDPAIEESTGSGSEV